MSAPTIAASDAELLARYLRKGCEGSFGALVAAHQQMVLGTALRRTGDAELARDVAQQVFALLARKAQWLAGRESLAGWLYQAASYLGARAQRGEARARARHAALALEGDGGAREADHLAVLDESLTALGVKEREALVLHYFEDRSYAEMAETLGVTEAAARQRVSRALRSLGERLRRRGIGTSATALLVGGAVLQGTVPAQAGLATAALSSGPGISPAGLIFSTLMSHTPLKLALAAIVLAGLPVALMHETHNRLVSTQAALREARSVSAASPTPAAASDHSSSDLTAPPASGGDMLAAWDRFREAQTQRVRAEEKLEALQREVQRVETEVVVSYGPVEDIARRVSSWFAQGWELEKQLLNADDQERPRLARQYAEQQRKYGEIMTLSREASKMESEPENLGRYYAAVLGEMADLDAATREAVARVARERFAALAREGHGYAQRPKSDDGEWTRSRADGLNAIRGELIALLPEERRKDANLMLARLTFYVPVKAFPIERPKEPAK